MTYITLEGTKYPISGSLPEIGCVAPDFVAIDNFLGQVHLNSFEGKSIVLNIFPSLDTPVCAKSVRAFNQIVSQMNDIVLLCISVDLPFSQKRFCGTEGIHNARTLSVFHNSDFGKDYGLTITEGPFAGLLARAVFVLDRNKKIVYKELVTEISNEPNYEKAIFAL